MIKYFRFIFFLSLVLVNSCALISPPANSLYQRLGRTTGLEAIIDDFTNELIADDRISTFFTNINLTHFKEQLVSQLCQASGGDCQYQGADMLSAHEGLGIQEEDFAALVEDLVKTLTKFNVSEADQAALLTLLGPMKEDIVETKVTRPIANTVQPPNLDAKTPPILLEKPIKSATKTSIDSINKPARQSSPPTSPAITKNPEPAKNKALQPVASADLTKKISSKKDKLPTESAQDKKLPPSLSQLKGQITLLGGTKNDHMTVVLEPLSPLKPLKKYPAQTHVAIIKKKTYLPQYLTIQRGDKVAFHNLDKIKHNVFSASQGSRFDLGTFKTGKRPATQLINNGIVKVYCDIHSKMAMFIRVTDSPFHQVTDAQGQFDFSAIPAGRYKLRVWTIRGHTERSVEIVSNEPQVLHITLDTRHYKKQPHLNKSGLPYAKKPDKPEDDEEYF